MENDDKTEIVALAKEIIQKSNLNARVEELTDCKDEFFVSLYKGLIGDNIQGLISDPVGEKEHVHNCKCVIDSLASDVLNVDLSHINAKEIVSGDVMSIRNLLEIFSGLLEYFMECIENDQSDFEDNLHDSNAMTADHDVISSLLQEEFGSPHKDHSNTDALIGKQVRTIQKPYDSRRTTDPSFRLSSFTGSGHEADFSEVSDSTNELIKLGESSSSGNSSMMKSESLREILQKKSTKTTWQQSTISDNVSHQDLTQYPMSSDDGEKDSFINAYDRKNGSSDHLSSSLVSSTSSWQQQISPLDADDNGIKLDTIGIRPKADNFTTANKDGSEDGGSSGRSSPILHHHYHHHFHHPADPKIPRTENVSSSHCNEIKGYRKIPGNIKTSGQVSSAMLPGAKSSARVTLPESLPGQLESRQSLHGTSVLTSREASLPGKAVDSPRVISLSKAASIHGQNYGVTTIPDYSRLETGFAGKTLASSLSSQDVLPRSMTSAATGCKQRIPLSDFLVPSIAEEHVRSRVPTAILPDNAYLRTGHNGYSSTTTTRVLAGLTDQNQTIPGTGSLQTSLTGQSITTSTTSLPGIIPMTGIPNQSQSKTSFQKERPANSVSVTATSNTLPGQDYTICPRLKDYSRLGTSLQAGRPIACNVSTRDPVPYPSTHPANTSLRVPLSDSLGRNPSNSIIPGQSSLREQYLLSKGASTIATTSLPSSSGLLTVSSGGYSDVFTSTNTDMSKQYVPHSRSLDTRQPRESKELLRTRQLDTDMIPTASKDDRQHNELLSHGLQPGSTVEPMDSDIDSDNSDAARYSDSAIDYNRGADQEVDSDNESSEDSILRRIHDRWKRLKTSQSTNPPSRRGVTFNDDIETIPITSRMERLRRLLDDEEQEQRQQTAAIRSVYADQLQDIQKQQQQDRKQMKKRKVEKSPLIPKKKSKKTVPSKQRGRLEAIYRPQCRLGRPGKQRPVKNRKRSASASPDIGRRRKNTLAEFHETLLPSLFDEFPFLHVSPQTTHSMWQKQARQISLLSKTETTALKTKGQRRVEEAEKRQEQLLKILRKELEHNERMRSERERKDHQRTFKAKVNEKRQVAARARRYYDEYQLRMRAKMLKRRTREEQILKKLFDDGLEIQKQRVRELRKYAKEKSEAIEQRQSNEIESLENYYKDQFSMLTEDMTRERQEMKVRQQAQEKVMRQMRRELRKKMEKEIEDLQETLTRDEDSAYFRQLEADRLRREFQLAMFKSDL